MKNYNFTINDLMTLECIARKAGKAIMGIYDQPIDVTHKNDNSPLTLADLAANTIIVEDLQANYPDIPILSEESEETFKGVNQNNQYWLVDPLDGTKEFIKHNDEFTVNIALIEKGIPVLGVVYAPALDLMYSALKDGGAFKQTKGKTKESIHTNQNPLEPLKIVGSRSHSDEKLNEWLKRLPNYKMLPMGSSLKICLVAEGRADIYPRLGPTRLWDTAAGDIILNEAGGYLTQLDGNNLVYENTDDLLNPFFIAIGSATLNVTDV